MWISHSRAIAGATALGVAAAGAHAMNRRQQGYSTNQGWLGAGLGGAALGASFGVRGGGWGGVAGMAAGAAAGYLNSGNGMGALQGGIYGLGAGNLARTGYLRGRRAHTAYNSLTGMGFESAHAWKGAGEAFAANPSGLRRGEAQAVQAATPKGYTPPDPATVLPTKPRQTPLTGQPHLLPETPGSTRRAPRSTLRDRIRGWFQPEGTGSTAAIGEDIGRASTPRAAGRVEYDSPQSNPYSTSQRHHVNGLNAFGQPTPTPPVITGLDQLNHVTPQPQAMPQTAPAAVPAPPPPPVVTGLDGFRYTPRQRSQAKLNQNVRGLPI